MTIAAVIVIIIRLLLLLFIPKMGQEWMLHFAELHPWGWTKDVLLGIES